MTTYGHAATHMTTNRDLLEFDSGVRAYPPARPHGYWRIRWEEAGRRRDTSARSRTEAIAKATELVERLSRGTTTDLARASGAELVAHYLDPARRPPRGQPWSERHRDEQVRYANLHVLPEIALIACQRLTRVDFQRIIDRAPTPSVAQHLRRCLTGIVNAGLEEGHLLPRQDLLRGVRWQPGADNWTDAMVRAITEDEIPTTAASRPWPPPPPSGDGRCGGGSWKSCSWPTAGCAGGNTPPSLPIASTRGGGASPSTARSSRPATPSSSGRPKDGDDASPCTPPSPPAASISPPS